MLSIDEAIVKYKEITNTDAICPAHCNTSCDKCVKESKQLAEWLEELKEIKSNGRYVQGNKAGQKIGYRNAIDDFAKEICKTIAQSESNGNYRFYAVEIKQAIADLAEQLKEGGENEI